MFGALKKEKKNLNLRVFHVPISEVRNIWPEVMWVVLFCLDKRRLCPVGRPQTGLCISLD